MKNVIKLANGKLKVQTINNEPSKTQQQFKEQSDINAIMRKYHKGEMISHLNQKQGQYIDLSTMPDYQSALQTVIDAQASFMTLPSEVRKKFQNDPHLVVQFLSDPKNAEEAFKLGLTKTNPSLPPPVTPPLSSPPPTSKTKKTTTIVEE